MACTGRTIKLTALPGAVLRRFGKDLDMTCKPSSNKPRREAWRTQLTNATGVRALKTTPWLTKSDDRRPNQRLVLHVGLWLAAVEAGRVRAPHTPDAVAA
jgi:hypothetical protein